MGTIADKNTESCEFYVRYCTFGPDLWYNSFYNIVRFCVTAFAVRFDTDQRRRFP